MSERNNSARTTISIPIAVKRRMDEVTENVNWSALACRAFEERIAQLEAQKEVKSMEEVIQRLRQLRRTQESDSYGDGEIGGTRWAMDKASEDELNRLEELYAGLSGSEWKAWFDVSERALDLVKVINPALKTRQALAFWRAIPSQKKVHDSDYCRGFAEGALAVWNQVKEKL